MILIMQQLENEQELKILEIIEILILVQKGHLQAILIDAWLLRSILEK